MPSYFYVYTCTLTSQDRYKCMSKFIWRLHLHKRW